MIKKNKASVFPLFILGILLLILAASGEASDKKFIVSADNASIHLNPDGSSPVIEVLEKGEYLTSDSPRKFRKVWNYVYFVSKKNGKTKSGYVHDACVERMYRTTKSQELGVTDQRTGDTIATISSLQVTKWGMSLDQVLGLEGRPVLREITDGMEVIGYQKKVLDKDCLVGYLFVDNKLFKTQYNFVERHSNKSHYLNDYERVKILVAQRYGKPEGEAVDWNDPHYKNDADNWGTALSLGHVKYLSRWLTSESEIILSLFKTDEDVLLRIEYSGIQIAD
ncbi:MAG: hypothetical protein JW755_04440 [Candidatus Aminicenantes bacterium]|nr:hypothetical protein [Candidatus Aminicenantes bacterium]